MIYVVGDSHARSYRQEHDPLTGMYSGVSPVGIGWYEVGAATAYNLIKDDSTVQAKRKILEFIREKGLTERYVFMFGEVDCRLHIYDQYSRNLGSPLLEDYVEATVNRYGLFMELMKKYGVTFAVLTIPPVSSLPNSFHYKHFASAELRAKIHKLFNEKLKAYCRFNGVKCFDFYGKISDADGFMLRGCSKDGCHLLCDKALPLLMEELKRVGWM